MLFNKTSNQKTPEVSLYQWVFVPLTTFLTTVIKAMVLKKDHEGADY